MVSKQKGTYDLYGKKALEEQALRSIFESIMERYNYSYIRTPLFEATELFHRGVGETSDIVTKETYDFKDRGDRNITLRPEGTAGVVRSYIENKMYADSGNPKKLWYYGPMYRYERPQKGRYREHYQFGCEVFGSNDPLVDAEIINIPVTLFNMLGLSDVKVKINSLGDEESRKNYKEALIEYLKPNINNLCEDCKKRFEKNPLRILDCKVDKGSDILKNVPKVLDYLNDESKERFERVLKYMDALGIDYEVSPNTVRGLDYYSHTVFEIEASVEGFGAQNVLCAGGRYNNLVKELGGPDTPAMGFGMGSERLLAALEAENIVLSDDNYLDCYVAPVTENEKADALALVETLRYLNIKTDMDYNSRSIKANFKNAEKLNAGFVIILGEDEVKNGYMTIKNMITKEERKVKNEEVIMYLAENLSILDRFEEECECGCLDHECDCDDDCNCNEHCTCGEDCDCDEEHKCSDTCTCHGEK